MIPTYEPLADLDGKVILVTGGTGSFGRHFIRSTLARWKPERLIVFSRDELKQYEMQQDPELAGHGSVRYFLGDVRDPDRLEMAFRGVDTVIHAAALKQVPAAEYNPFECIHTNVNGAENVVRAALRCGVRRVVALSTDKACNPVNLYGASKLASDKIFVAANNLSGGADTRFAVVRYGNVLGSRGSIVPLFRRLIGEGAKSLPITDPRMTRFWITLDQGVDFVISSLALMQGGEIMVPKCPSMKIVDMARAMAPDMAHDIIGVRPGEKLHEVLVTEDDARNTLDLGDRFVITPQFAFWRRGHYEAGGAELVPEGFRFDSEESAEPLVAEQFLEMLLPKDSGP